MENKASMTALMSSFARGYHTLTNENPVFRDSTAAKLFSAEEWEMMSRYILGGISFFAPDKADSFKSNNEALKYIVETQLAPTPLARSAFCENSLKTAVLTGTEQYVILGAGFDTFAFCENPLMQRLDVFEVDFAPTQQDKLKRLRRAELQIPKNLHFVPCDFTQDDLHGQLLSSGFDKNKKTFFSWLGVSYYLSKSEIEVFLKCVSELAADGSSLLFDYADSGLFLSDSRRVKNMLAMAQMSGEPMKSSFDEFSITSLLSDFGFLTYEHLSPSDIQKRFFDGAHGNLSAFENICLALCVYKKGN